MRILIPLIFLSQLYIWFAIQDSQIVNLSLRWPKEIMALLGIVCLLTSLIWKYSKPIACFILWSVIVFFYTKSYYVLDDGNIKAQLIPCLNLVNILLFGLFYYILHHIKLNKEAIYRAFCVIAIANTVYVLIQIVNLDQWFFSTSGYLTEHKFKYALPVGFWGNETLCGWSLAILSPFFLFFKKLRYKIGYGATFLATLATQSTTAIAAFVIGGLIVLFSKQRLLALILAVLLIFGGLLAYKVKPDYFDATGRFRVWGKSLQVWKKSRMTITGLGLGSYRRTFWRTSPEFLRQGVWAQAHNDYLQTLYEHGLVGLGILLWLIYGVKRGEIFAFASLVIFGLIMLNGFPMRTSMVIIPTISLVLTEGI